MSALHYYVHPASTPSVIYTRTLYSVYGRPLYTATIYGKQHSFYWRPLYYGDYKRWL